MPNILATLSFLSDSPIYGSEKPYTIFFPEDLLNSNVPRSNLLWEDHVVEAVDLRVTSASQSLPGCGFEVVPHVSKYPDIKTIEEKEAYRAENTSLLQRHFNSAEVICFDVLVRENNPRRPVIDLRDPLFVDRPSDHVHVDVTASNFAVMINRHVPPSIRSRYPRPTFRYRIVNTWRALQPTIEDRPLAVCDRLSVDNTDLVAADKVYPTRVGEVYYLKFSEKQKWYWLDSMTSDESLIFLQHDSHLPKDIASGCPHTSFYNSRAAENAPPRRSVETRSVVISRAEVGSALDVPSKRH